MADQFDQARRGSRWPDHPGEPCDCPTCERVRSGEPLFSEPKGAGQ